MIMINLKHAMFTEYNRRTEIKLKDHHDDPAITCIENTKKTKK